MTYMKGMRSKSGFLIVLSMVVGALGCQPLVDDIPTPRGGDLPPVEPVPAVAEAGVRAQVGPPKLAEDLIVMRTVQPVFAPRVDPFRLRPFEAEWDIKQGNLRVVEQVSGDTFGPVFTVVPQVVTVTTLEPQPYRRLAGVVVGDSVMAIIDMGDGRPMQLIRPGMQIPNSPWRVVSIDSEKAVIRRTGNRLPKEVVVRLENPPALNRGPVEAAPAAGAAPPGGSGPARGRGAGSRGSASPD